MTGAKLRDHPFGSICPARAEQLSVLELDASQIVSFGLEQVNEAVTHASEHAGPFEATVLVPSSSARRNVSPET
jgi:hypothetical protein